MFSFDDWGNDDYPKTMGVHDTRCKHGTKSCDLCGTSEKRDFVHHTEGGRGSVSKLTKSKR